MMEVKMIKRWWVLVFIGLLITLSFGQGEESNNTYSIIQDKDYSVPAQGKVKITIDLPKVPDDTTGSPDCRLIGKIIQTNEDYDINCYIRTPDGKTILEEKTTEIDVDMSTTTSKLSLFLDNTYSMLTPKRVWVYLIFISWEKEK